MDCSFSKDVVTLNYNERYVQTNFHYALVIQFTCTHRSSYETTSSKNNPLLKLK